MTEQDRHDFATLMLGLGETYGEPVSDVRMEIYFRALADLELADVRHAATACVRLSKFFPRPAELREAMDGTVEDRAELAWAEVRRLVRRVGFYAEPRNEDWPDDASQRAALELYGGWKALCASLPADGPELLGYRKQFLATYRAYESRGHRELLAEHESREISTDDAKRMLTDLKSRTLPVSQ